MLDRLSERVLGSGPEFLEARRGVAATPEDVYKTLEARGHDLEVARSRTVTFGGGQAIYKLDDGYFGASDLRRDGQAVGF